MNGWIQFAHPGFLWGLLGLGVPIFLHLMHRERPRRVVFPSLRFIFKGRLPEQGRRGLRDLITLLMRLGILALLVLLFADPRRPLAAVAAQKNAGEIVFFCDLSASMNAFSPQTAWLQTIDRVIKANPGAVFGLIASDERGQRVQPLTSDPTLIRQGAEKLKASLYAGNHDAALQQAVALFSATPNVRRRLFILTDAQRSDWAISSLTPFKRNVEVQVVQPAKLPEKNLGIERVRSEYFVRGDSRRLRASVRVRNYGVAPATAQLTVRTGSQKTSSEITVAGGTAETFILDLESPVGHLGEARVDAGDAYTPDDSWFFWFGARPPISVRILHNRDPKKNVELFFLHTALAAKAPGTIPCDVTVATVDSPDSWNLKKTDCVILLDLFSEEKLPDLAPLRAFVEQGGALLVFSGRGATNTLRALAAAGITHTRCLGFKGDRARLFPYTISEKDNTFPGLAPFTDDAGDLMQFPIYYFTRLSPPSSATVPLKIGNTPFLVRERKGRGEVFLFAIGLNPEWSECPTSLSFVPLLRELIETSRNRRGRPQLTFSRSMRRQIEAADIAVPPLPAITQPGVYMLGTTPVAVNVSRRESTLHREEPFDIARRLVPENTPSPDLTRATALAGVAPWHSLRPLLAWILVALIFGELLAANLLLHSRTERNAR